MARRNLLNWARWHGRAWLAAMCLIASHVARANITVELHGLDEQLRTNVLAYLSFERYKKRTDLAPTRLSASTTASSARCNPPSSRLATTSRKWSPR